MSKKYELVKDDFIDYNGHKLYRIKALIDFSNVFYGDLGGYIQSENNLSQFDDCWVYDNAKVCGNAKVFGHALIHDNAFVLDNALICENAEICDNSIVEHNSVVRGNAMIYGESCVSGDAMIYDNAKLYNESIVSNHAQIYGNAKLYNKVNVFGNVHVFEEAELYDRIHVDDNVLIHGDVKIYGSCCELKGNADIQDYSDYIVFKNWWSSGRYFIWTRSNNMWTVGCFHGTGDELIAKAYDDSEESGKQYEAIVQYVNKNALNK